VKLAQTCGPHISSRVHAADSKVKGEGRDIYRKISSELILSKKRKRKK
jgi:hypothetical protein